MRKINLLVLLSIYATAVKGSEKWQSFANTTKKTTTTATDVSVLDAAAASGAGIFLERKRRYLIFDKGAAVVFQGNIAKSLIAVTPRGINWIAEYTLTYDLPSMLEFFRPDYLFARKPTKAQSTTTTTRPTKMTTTQHWQRYWQKPWPNQQWQKSQVAAKFAQPKPNWPKKKQFYVWPRVESQRRRTLWCTRENAYKKYDDWSYAKIVRWCRGAKPTLKRRYRTVEDQTQNQDRSEVMFFDLLGKWAEIHEYNPRHCIMRTLCEAPHLLLPPGNSLLHDLLRIMENYAMRHAAVVYAAAAVAGLASFDECARLFGPHCRVSFLQHFTIAVHGKCM